MWTFRKACIAAACMLAFFFLLRGTHVSSSAPPIEVASSRKTDTSSPTRSYPPPSAPKKPSRDQHALENIADKPLRDRLRYQHPYDLESKFPGYIWQTWKSTPASGDFEENLRRLEASWSEKHPGFVHEVITDDVAEHLIRYLYASVPEVLEAYRSLPIPVLKADFFRYLILLARGGIYSDIDTEVLRPATDWLPENFDTSTIGLVVGIEADPDRADWQKWYSRRIQFCQWTIQSKPGHPVLRDVVATITEDVLRMKQKKILRVGKMDKSVVEFTGPAVWTDAIFHYFNNPDYFDVTKSTKNISAMDFTGLEKHKRVGDVVVLPITSFSPGVQQMGAKEMDDEMAFVHHQFEGSWKPENERRIGG